MDKTVNQFAPEESLSASLINRLRIHVTVSSLRSAATSAIETRVIDGTKSIPTLYYLFSGDGSYTVHALIADLHKYLLSSSTVKVTDEVEI